ncbi:facilitated trehalose transporter Tret1-2 homolog [Anthonomus grandis grandis]|uniref:facilitated trehalose transporter Tret1-2 homolog n=1 Tax=Anthonomus grandis grandis TaxID=2921223 RepID=UPI00216500AC|nr:facilitated trehalose transporter Tret1-2 homolog [Anthonomus grandis grandis]
MSAREEESFVNSLECERGESKKLVEDVYKTTVYTAENEGEGESGPSRESACWFLHWAAITADVPLYTAGLAMSWTSPVIPRLRGSENPFDRPVTTTEEAWIASFTPLGSAIGPIAAGYCADKLGRKKALLALSLPMLLGFIILAVAKQIELYYFARFLIGLGAGGAFAVVPMYVGEISQAHNRGKYGSAMGVLITLGIIYPFSIGPLLSLPIYSLTCGVPLLIFMLVFSIFMPESPYYLTVQGDYAGAERSLRKLRQRGTTLRNELIEIKDGVEQERKNTAGVKELFTSPGGRKALYISFGLVALQQFAGINPLLSFMGSIYESAGTDIPPNVCTIITGCVQVASNTACIFMVEKMGRKLLLLVCCIFCFMSMTVLGLYFFFKGRGYDMGPVFWLPITCLIVYMLVFSFGLGPLPWTVMGEIFPANVKGIASALTSTTSFLTSSLITFIFPIISANLGMAGGFWLFAAFCLIGYFFIYFELFETKGKSLAEIQRILQKDVK